MSKYGTAIIFGIAIVLASIVLGNAYVARKKVEGTIQVTGLGSKDFTSDLIVWEGKFTSQNPELKQAYSDLNISKEVIQKYLLSKGVAVEDLVFSAVQSTEKTRPMYGSNGNYIGATFEAYELSQTVQIESTNVNSIEKISREITELLNQGVQLYSQPPRYYYTQLADLKIEMISKATEDARIRAEKIAENSGGELGALESAKMGIFQITGQNSAEDYSWGGAFNTSSKDKTASITMKLIYSTN